MKETFKKKLLEEAIRIGDEIISKSVYDDLGLTYLTLNMDKGQKVILEKSIDIYTGVSGICLFLNELYLHSGERRFLETSIESFKWLQNMIKKYLENNYSFLTGKCGVAYLSINLYKITLEQKYLESALEITKECESFIEGKSFFCEYLNGIMGVLLSLLHIYDVSKSKDVLEKIDFFLKQVIEGSHFNNNGIYWNRSQQVIKGLCGFSHGASGVGFVLLEIAHYFQNEALKWLAEQAFVYESNYYNKKINNWPDFRKGIWQTKDYDIHKEAYNAKDYEYFTKPVYMNAWCHGAAGIGLSRLRAYEILKKEQYCREAKSAIKKTIVTEFHNQKGSISYTLCHGKGGNAEIFIEAARVFKKSKYLTYANKIASRALELKKHGQNYISGMTMAGEIEDLGLFMGNAGIGYFYLRLVDFNKTNSILAPRIIKKELSNNNKKKYQYVNIKKENLQILLLKQIFPRTILFLENYYPGFLSDFFDNRKDNDISLKVNFINDLKKYIKHSEKTKLNDIIKDIFKVEIQIFKMDQNIKSYSLLNIKRLTDLESGAELQDIENNVILLKKFRIDENVKIISSKWDWSSISIKVCSDNYSIRGSRFFYIIKQMSETTTIEKILSPLTVFILKCFKNPKSAYEVLDQISQYMKFKDNERLILSNKLCEQIIEFMKAGVLELIK